MEEINGVSFRDYACASANLVAGMPLEEICKVLGIEQPVWEATVEGWNNKMAELSMDDMAFYGEVFTNPKQGKFANVETNIPTIDDILKQIPDYDAYQKIFWHQGEAHNHGIDSVTVLEEYGLNLQQWSQLGMHYMKWHSEYLGDHTHPEYNDRFQEVSKTMEKWENHWKEFYKDSSVDLSGDIDF